LVGEALLQAGEHLLMHLSRRGKNIVLDDLVGFLLPLHIGFYFFFFFLLVSLPSFSIHTELSKGPYTPIFFSLFELADKPN
jgi:hypothetical protein